MHADLAAERAKYELRGDGALTVREPRLAIAAPLCRLCLLRVA